MQLGDKPLPERHAQLRKNAPSMLLVGAIFAVGGFLFARNLANDASPVRSVQSVAATVKSAQWGGRTRTGATYVLLLDEGATVLADDDRPHLIGSHVAIERVARDNGFVFYRFPE